MWNTITNFVKSKYDNFYAVSIPVKQPVKLTYIWLPTGPWGLPAITPVSEPDLRKKEFNLEVTDCHPIFTDMMNGVNQRVFRHFLVLHLDCLEIVRMTSTCKLANDLVFSLGHFKYNFSNFEAHLKKQMPYALPLLKKKFTRVTLM